MRIKVGRDIKNSPVRRQANQANLILPENAMFLFIAGSFCNFLAQLAAFLLVK